jgi:toxin ParE1/3/4
MMYRLSPQAEQDLEAIGDYIARDSAGNARRFIERLTQKFVMLGRNPDIGRARPELRPDLRSFPYGAYLILHRIANDGVEICVSSIRRATSTTCYSVMAR